MYLSVATDGYTVNVCPCRQAGTTEQTGLRPGRKKSGVQDATDMRRWDEPGSRWEHRGADHEGPPGRAAWVLQVGTKKLAAMGLGRARGTEGTGLGAPRDAWKQGSRFLGFSRSAGETRHVLPTDGFGLERVRRCPRQL